MNRLYGKKEQKSSLSQAERYGSGEVRIWTLQKTNFVLTKSESELSGLFLPTVMGHK